MSEILDKPPEDEGDDQEAGGGPSGLRSVSEDELEDANPLEEGDLEGDDDEPDA